MYISVCVSIHPSTCFEKACNMYVYKRIDVNGFVKTIDDTTALTICICFCMCYVKNVATCHLISLVMRFCLFFSFFFLLVKICWQSKGSKRHTRTVLFVFVLFVAISVFMHFRNRERATHICMYVCAYTYVCACKCTCIMHNFDLFFWWGQHWRQ